MQLLSVGRQTFGPKAPEMVAKQGRQESPMGILTGRSDPPHPLVSQMLARSCIYTNQRDEKCDCVTQYFDHSVTG